MYYVYFIQSEKDKSFYIGYCKDLKKRILDHNCGKTKSIKNKIPYKLIYYESYLSKKDAIIREKNLKRNGMQKEFIIKNIHNSLIK